MSTSTTGDDKHPINIIAVEDDIVTIQFIRMIFEKKYGCTVKIYETGEEFLENITWEYDIALVNIQLPGIDGFDVVKAIRENPNKKIASMPIIFETGDSSPETKLKAKQAGVNGYIVKPLTDKNCGRVLDYFRDGKFQP